MRTLLLLGTVLLGGLALAAEPPTLPATSARHAGLLDPTKAAETAPAVYKAKFATTEGEFVIEVHREWAPKAADRFYSLVKVGFFDGVGFFRAISGFMVQFGLNGDPMVNEKWGAAKIMDDPVTQSNTRGMVSFASAGPNTRTTQVFISYVDNSRLDPMGFAAFGKVVSGMDVVDALYTGYGEGAPRGRGPDQGRLRLLGNAYLTTSFPELDYVTAATIVP